MIPASILIRDNKTAAEHVQAAEELLGAAATLCHGAPTRRRTRKATVLAELAQGHALTAAAKNQLS